MARDIEEFLKMAAKRRQQQKQGGQPAAGRPARPAATQRPAPRRPQPPMTPATDDEIVIIGGSEAPAPSIGRQSVSDHVSSHIDTSSLAQHASSLGETVALADDKLDARLTSTFDHKVGHLNIDRSKSAQSTTTTTTAKDVSPLARDLLTMLGNPQSVRQAILLSEVLQRPNFD